MPAVSRLGLVLQARLDGRLHPISVLVQDLICIVRALGPAWRWHGHEFRLDAIDLPTSRPAANAGRPRCAHGEEGKVRMLDVDDVPGFVRARGWVTLGKPRRLGSSSRPGAGCHCQAGRSGAAARTIANTPAHGHRAPTYFGTSPPAPGGPHARRLPSYLRATKATLLLYKATVPSTSPSSLGTRPPYAASPHATTVPSWRRAANAFAVALMPSTEHGTPPRQFCLW